MLAGLTIMKYLSGNGACRYASMVMVRVKSVMSGPGHVKWY